MNLPAPTYKKFYSLYSKYNDYPEKILVQTGQMIFTPPMVDHAMKFPTDTLFLTLSSIK